jgi:hypothetical protein
MQNPGRKQPPIVSFRPLSFEARVFYDSELWVDAQQKRLAAINGHLVEDVRFGGGLDCVTQAESSSSGDMKRCTSPKSQACCVKINLA